MKENYYNCIYMYENKINGKKYIGKAKNFNIRHKQHIKSSYNENNSRDYNCCFHRAIRKYGINNFKIKILAENLTNKQMNDYEKFFIKRYNTLSKNNNGYNIAEGGEGGNLFVGKTDEEMNEFKEKISKKAKERLKNKENHPMYGTHRDGKDAPMYGKHHTEESKKKNSESHKGKKLSKETKEKLSEIRRGEKHPMYGKHHSEETKQKQSIAKKNKYKGKNNPRAKKVAQYDLDGNLIKIWDCIEYASYELGIGRTGISDCCRHKQKTSGNFIWKYIE